MNTHFAIAKINPGEIIRISRSAENKSTQKNVKCLKFIHNHIRENLSREKLKKKLKKLKRVKKSIP